MFWKKDISKWSDEELLEKYRSSGNKEYFGELFNRYIPLLYGVCLKYLQEENRSKDAVMQLFENILPKVRENEIIVFRTWIYSVVKNHCLQILRKNSRELIVDFNSELMESEDILHLLNEETEEEELLAHLKKCMDKLPEPQRISIENFFIHEMSYQDIVDDNNFTKKQVKSYIQNGKRNLKRCMERNQ